MAFYNDHTVVHSHSVMIIKEFTMVVMVIIRHVYVTSFQRSPVLIIMFILTPQIEHHFSRSRYPPVHKKRYDVDHDYEISHFNYIPIILHDSLIACSPRLLSLPEQKLRVWNPPQDAAAQMTISWLILKLSLSYIPFVPRFSFHYCRKCPVPTMKA